MIKYNEIMNRITVDPEMKSRVMSAVSAAIKENSDGAAVVTDIPKETSDKKKEEPVRKKAKRSPLVIISSIAAAVVVLLGVLFLFRLMGGNSKTASTTQYKPKNHAENAVAANDAIDAALGGDKAPDYEFDDNVAYETETQGAAEDTTESQEDRADSHYSVAPHGTDVDLTDGALTITTGSNKNDYTTGMGDERMDRISRVLPFDLKGTGKGSFSSDISMEVFLGEQSQKVLILSAAEGTDIMKQFAPTNKSTGTDGVTPGGIAVKYYYIAFGNVPELGKDQTSAEVNAALYTRDGMTYLIVFSDFQTQETIADVIDAV